VAEEYELWDREAAGDASESARLRLDELKASLDQCWDLLRQRRALRDAGRDPDAASPETQRQTAIVNLMVQYSTSVDRAFAALADPTRRAVLERLGAGSASISELAEPFGMSLTGMKKHVRLLEEAELVTTEKIGRVRLCTLVPYAFEGISTWLQRLDRFAQVVERTKGAR
jgi:DNA-binding transcriptional ArsR family regulator